MYIYKRVLDLLLHGSHICQQKHSTKSNYSNLMSLLLTLFILSSVADNFKVIAET